MANFGHLAVTGKFDGELDQEVRIEKFTAAEFGEEEQTWSDCAGGL